jgi:hypothetical protein
MEFLMQSIESHDRQLGELAERMDTATANIIAMGKRGDALDARVDRLAERVDNLVETTQLNFDRLTKAMMGLTDHVVDHQHRLEDLERN